MHFHYFNRKLKQLDGFKRTKSFNISRKKKGNEVKNHHSEDNYEKLGSKTGGVFTILLFIFLISNL